MKINAGYFMTLVLNANRIVMDNIEFERCGIPYSTIYGKRYEFVCKGESFSDNSIIQKIRGCSNIRLFSECDEMFFRDDKTKFIISAITRNSDVIFAIFDKETGRGYYRNNNIRSGYMKADAFSEFIYSNYMDWIVL